MAKHGFLLDADYTEDAVALAIEAFLALATFPFLRFSLLPFSRKKERWLGADARIQGPNFQFRPFYMQFKRPSAYPEQSTSRIIIDRKKVQPRPLQTSPRTLFFKLREKQINHRDYQHNVLYRLNQRLHRKNLGDAVYVCPLFLDRSAYRFYLHIAALRRCPFFWRDPWDWDELLIDDSRRTIRFDRIPILSEHICIPPHKRVTNARHCYSFTEDGTQVCFHSPEFVEKSCVPLSKWLYGLISDLAGEDFYLDAQNAKEALSDLLIGDKEEEALPHPPDVFEIDDGIQSWLHWGSYLREFYGIEQYALVRQKDD